jgi:hypothetical protein
VGTKNYKQFCLECVVDSNSDVSSPKIATRWQDV